MSKVGVKEPGWYVYYDVAFPGKPVQNAKAGPYSKSDVQYQRDDIAGFMYIRNVRVVEVKPND